MFEREVDCYAGVFECVDIFGGMNDIASSVISWERACIKSVHHFVAGFSRGADSVFRRQIWKKLSSFGVVEGCY